MNKQILEKTKVFNKAKYLPLVLIVIGVLAYINTFNCPFIFDDESSILENPNIRYLWPFNKGPAPFTVSGRPIVSLTLALNYAISKYSVWSYHVVNLVIHLLGGLTLYGIVRRTLLSTRLRERFGKHSAVLAWVIATIWVVHPIQTESVTYIIQRAESLMGLFYLLMLYAAIRAIESRRGIIWHVICVISCGLGMMTKEVMVTAPVIVLLYDRAFAAGSFGSALRRRWGLYASLGAMWGLLAIMLWMRPVLFRDFDFTANISTLDYALNQFIVLVHYLRLCVWPNKLCLFYGWEPIKDLGRILPSMVLILIILGVTVWGFVRNRGWGFLAVWFFGILALTSSFIALKNLVFEHRLYLSLAGLTVFVVTGGYILLLKVSRRLSKGSDAAAGVIGSILAIAVICSLTFTTIWRNKDYRSAISIWQKTIDVVPDNHGAYNNLGNAFRARGNIDEAVGQYHKALQIEP
ncbi:MAG: glycosyltransferase family 39 protein, partial [Planctomycetota bacterium]